MISNLAATLALRNRALSLTVCTTGSVTLSVTTTGYARADGGSFVTDGFVVGMEILAAGFTAPGDNGNGIITALTATAMAVDAYTVTLGPTGYTVAARTLVTEAAAAARTISVKLPALRAFENVALTPVAGRPYITEEFIPATAELVTFPAQGGRMAETGLYVLTWYGLVAVAGIPGIGVSSLRKSVDALKLLYAPGTTLAVGSDTLHVRGDTAVRTGQIIPLAGWAALQLTVPWRARSVNTIAA